ncbi:MAG: hypothetical protein JW839_04505 [Candidatus Lokiarchaeota archaeon]|nr:hypothetical protein [Candidatus Lokiarchaeota archaeon]
MEHPVPPKEIPHRAPRHAWPVSGSCRAAPRGRAGSGADQGRAGRTGKDGSFPRLLIRVARREYWAALARERGLP